MHQARFRTLALCLSLGLSATWRAGAADAPSRPAYPKAPRASQVDDYHGTLVSDPFRPLEDPDAPATRAWIDAENTMTRAFLDAVPARTAIRERLTKLWNYERFSTPVREGGRLFYSHNDGLQNQAVLYVLDREGATPRALLDPNRLSKDGTVAVAGWSVSRDGRSLAYAVASGGSDWQEWHVLDVGTGRDTGDLLKWVKFSSPAFTADGKGLYYARCDAPPSGRELDAAVKNQRVFFHRLGTPQAADVLVHAPDDPKVLHQVRVSDDGRWLVLSTSRGSSGKNRLWVKDLTRDGAPFLKLFDDFESRWSWVGNEGTIAYLRTDRSAPRGRLVSVDFAADAPVLKDVIPQGDAVLRSVRAVGGRFVVVTMQDGSERVRIHALDGTPGNEVALPALGAVNGFTGRPTDRETFFSFTSFTYPSTVFRLDPAAATATVFRKPRVDFDPSAFDAKQVFYRANDGAAVPMFLVAKKGTKWDGSNPTMLFAYGGFNVPMLPSFSVKSLAFVERGGIYAQACLRGGSEYGDEWHEAGMLEKKQNVFDDFAAAARWLIANKVTSAKKLAIAGGSNGGLLVGATLNQHPELFGAALPAVGVMDMLRFQRFTIGWAWTSEYGSAENADQFKFIYAYSPLHNIRKGSAYPAVLITTADHDDRVVPAHSFKYAAALQEAQAGDAPVLIRIETRAGHGAGKPTTKLIEEASDQLAFLAKTIGDPAR
ncbi:MAG TPA: prolyl oligopeptidase family serine peptidase [Thermoanaerobaculia bacterium]|nr:prolyl oligopeptidase family serine peptidase [Thermoanaerobaculia bacterium]